MKRFTKIALISSGICLTAGIGLCISGVVLGYEPGSILEEYRVKSVSMREGSYELSDTQEYEDVTSLKVSIGAADCQIVAYDGDMVRVDTDNTRYLKCRNNGRQLIVEYGPDDEDGVFQWFGLEDMGFIKIYVPETLELKELDLEGGAANITAENLICQDVEMEIGAGALIYEGSVLRKISADCGAGSVEVIVDGEASDYNYDLECGLGSIEVEGGPEIAGIGDTRIDNKADKKMELECGLGSIEVSFR